MKTLRASLSVAVLGVVVLGAFSPAPAQQQEKSR